MFSHHCMLWSDCNASGKVFGGSGCPAVVNKARIPQPSGDVGDEQDARSTPRGQLLPQVPGLQLPYNADTVPLIDKRPHLKR